MITIWSGAIDDIPPGYALCDGNNGTPDLRDRFVVGAGDTYAPQDTGGVDQTTIAVSDTGHIHDVSAPIEVEVASGEGVTQVWRTSPSVSSDGEAQVETDQEFYDNKPLYYALAYIMKL